MAKKPSNVPIFVAVGMGLAMLIGMNAFQYKNRPRSPDELLAEATALAEKNKETGVTPKPAVSPEGQEMAAYDSDTWVGPPNADKVITIGYRMTPDVQAEPMSVFGPVSMMMRQKSQGVRVHLVNLDDPSAPRVSEGMSYKGKVIVPLTATGGFDPTMIQSTVPTVMRDGI
ncbi:MAG: hypothetical protein RLZ42_866 [Armatimonadota bacterium]|jgi:hypothetical protein